MPQGNPVPSSRCCFMERRTLEYIFCVRNILFLMKHIGFLFCFCLLLFCFFKMQPFCSLGQLCFTEALEGPSWVQEPLSGIPK